MAKSEAQKREAFAEQPDESIVVNELCAADQKHLAFCSRNRLCHALFGRETRGCRISSFNRRLPAAKARFLSSLSPSKTIYGRRSVETCTRTFRWPLFGLRIDSAANHPELCRADDSLRRRRRGRRWAGPRLNAKPPPIAQRFHLDSRETIESMNRARNIIFRTL